MPCGCSLNRSVYGRIRVYHAQARKAWQTCRPVVGLACWSDPNMKNYLFPLAVLASAMMTALPASAQQWINQYGELCWVDTQMSPPARCQYTYIRGQSVYICCQRIRWYTQTDNGKWKSSDQEVKQINTWRGNIFASCLFALQLSHSQRCYRPHELNLKTFQHRQLSATNAH